MSFSGADPDGLAALGGTMTDRSETIDRAAATAMPILEAHEWWSAADRIGTALSLVSTWLRDTAGELAWRAGAIRDAQAVAVSAGLPEAVIVAITEYGHYATAAGFGVADHDAGFVRYRTSPPLQRLVALDPGDVAAVFDAMSPFAATRLVLDHPEVIATLRGAPAELRYRANQILIAREVDRLETEAGELRVRLAQLQEELHVPGMGQLTVIEITARRLEHVETRIETFRSWSGRQILLFDPEGDGRVVEVFGNLDDATHVAVLVPGITNTIDNFGPPDGGGFRENAANLYAEASDLRSSVATVAWLGYDTPGLGDAVLDDKAREGYGDLVDFVTTLDETGTPHVTVVGHSYGSFLTGMAALHGLPADDVVFVGSPGVPLSQASDAVLAPGAKVWAGLATNDPIGAGIDLKDPWTFVLGPGGKLLLDLIGSGDTAVKDLWHGRNPVHDSFGANQITTDGASGHSEYFAEGTKALENLAEIVAGLDPDVDLIGEDVYGSGGGGAW